VTTLLTLAEGDGWENPNNAVDEEEKGKLLNELMRSRDPNVRLRAIDLADKRRERALERRREAECELGDPLKTLDAIAVLDPYLAIRLAHAEGLSWEPPKDYDLLKALDQLDGARRWIMKRHQERAKGNGATAPVAA
jgi:hypothetical protein